MNNPDAVAKKKLLDFTPKIAHIKVKPSSKSDTYYKNKIANNHQKNYFHRIYVLYACTFEIKTGCLSSPSIFKATRRFNVR